MTSMAYQILEAEGKEEDKIKGSSPRSELDAPLMEASVVGATLDSCHLILQDKGFDNSIVINPCKAVGVKDVAELLRHRNSQSVTRPWNTSNRFFRPRVFCLEHATEVEELLASKGGANVLIICHSDFSKIKEQAVFIAEEMGIDFRVEVGSLNDPSRDDLELINLSIGDDENEECGEDWTSKLGVNLKFFVKLRKMSSMQEQHALALGGLFSDLTPTVDVPGLKWISRKSRTRHEAKYSCRSRSYGKKDCANSENFSNEPKNSGGSNAESSPIAADGKPRGRGRPRKYPAGGISQVKIIASSDEVVLASNCGNEKVEASSVISFSSTTSVSMHQTSGEQEQKRLSDKSVLADKTDCCTDSLDTPDLITEVQTLELSNGLMAWRADNSQMEDEIRANLEADLESEQSDIAASSGLARISISGSQLSERQRILKSMEESPTYDEACCSSKDPPNSSAGEANPPNSVVMRKISAIALSAAEISQQQIVNQVTSQLTSVAEAHYPKCLDGEAQSTLTDRVNSETKAEICSGEGTAPRSMICSKDGQDISRHIILVYSKKRRKLSDQKAKDHDSIGFIRSPCEGLRPRKSAGAINSIHVCHFSEGKSQKKLKKATCTTPKILSKPEEEAYGCNIEGCQMSFTTKAELSLHKRNRCTYRGCGKQFSSHKYASHHQKVHTDERPLKCPWKGCHMSFKWAWARTEHLRVHTGERPYKCNVEGCGLTFRFVSDFSRHRRKTGHSVSL